MLEGRTAETIWIERKLDNMLSLIVYSESHLIDS